MPKELSAATGFELLKLMMQIAWADHTLAPEEAALIRSLLPALHVSVEQAEEVEGWIDGRVKLPPPNLGVLKEERDQVLEALALMTLTDDEVHVDEEEMLAQIASLLS